VQKISVWPADRKIGVALAIAAAAEVAYIAGRSFITHAFADRITAELTLTAWRLFSLGVCAWLFFDVVRARPWRGLPWHPVLATAIASDLLAMHLAGCGTYGDWTVRLVFAATTPIVAMREELFYRGILQNALERRVHPITAVLISTTAFVLYHIGMQPMNFYTVIGLASGGFMLGVIYQRTRNLWIVVALHTVFDLIMVLPPRAAFVPVIGLAGNLITLGGMVTWWSLDRKGESS
jgi:membrane protease YdiL (CAAX protease family)